MNPNPWPMPVPADLGTTPGPGTGPILSGDGLFIPPKFTKCAKCGLLYDCSLPSCPQCQWPRSQPFPVEKPVQTAAEDYSHFAKHTHT
eukprot:2559265-Karenia_brevis.AAC.1